MLLPIHIYFYPYLVSINIKISTQEAYYSTMRNYDNPATGEMEISAGTYSIGQDIPAGVYDMTIVSGTANVNTNDYSFSAMLTDDAILAESVASSYKNLELLGGQILTVQSGTVKITATPNIVPLTP